MEGLLHLSFNRPFPEEEARLKNLWGKIRYKSYIIINQSWKYVKVKKIHIFLTASSGQPDCFYTVFFYDFPN